MHGVLQPIIVRTRADGTYELVAGERRLLRAACMAGLETIPAIVREPAAEESSLELALIENLQPTPISTRSRPRSRTGSSSIDSG